MNNIIHLPEITVYHWALAYGGLFLSLFHRLSLSTDKLNRIQRRREIFTTITGIFAIPMIFILIQQEDWLKEMLPITNITALFIGTQTKTIIKALLKLKKPDLSSLKNKDVV